MKERIRIFGIVKHILEDEGFVNVVFGANFVDDLGMDSIDVIQFSWRVEDFFKIEIPSEDFDRIKTVAGMVNFVKGRLEND